MSKFPVDAPIREVVKALERLGFELVREGNHIAMVRENPDGTRTPLTMPNQRTIKDRPSVPSSHNQESPERNSYRRTRRNSQAISFLEARARRTTRYNGRG